MDLYNIYIIIAIANLKTKNNFILYLNNYNVLKSIVKINKVKYPLKIHINSVFLIFIIGFIIHSLSLLMTERKVKREMLMLLFSSLDVNLSLLFDLN